MAATAPAQNRFVPIIRRRRSHRSANTPETGPSSRSGRYSAATVRPVARSDPVTRKIWVGMASVSSHEPSALTSPPAHISR